MQEFCCIVSEYEVCHLNSSSLGWHMPARHTVLSTAGDALPASACNLPVLPARAGGEEASVWHPRMYRTGVAE